MYYTIDDCDIDDFKRHIDRALDPKDVAHAALIDKDIPLYDCADLKQKIDQRDQDLLSEWMRVLEFGPGVFVLKDAYEDTEVIDRACEIYHAIIAREKANGGPAGDHFAKAGANDRIWNSLQKLCLEAPEIFVKYFSNTAIAAAAQSWLGPHYQMTSQVNLVRPGGAAQTGHRDYHLGFQTLDHVQTYPAPVHLFSPRLTLQGGIAHCDMDLDSGPTKLLPFSQSYAPGYISYHLSEFSELFEQRYVQLPLKKGDAIFFSPALFHGAGENRSKSTERLVDLLQISSAFGRPMEAVNRAIMCKALFPYLREAALPKAELSALIAATAEGYSFPTNLDQDPPKGGLAPKSQAQIFREAISENWDDRALEAALDALSQRQSP